ncbi:alpha/beta fold hydrolase, partial [Rothia sp. AR01]
AEAARAGAERAGLDGRRLLGLADLLRWDLQVPRPASPESAAPKPAKPEPALPEHAAEAPAPGLSDPAYLIFTSGTTGEPKGVQVPHRALAHLLASHRASVLPGPGEPPARLAHTTGVGFDAAMDPLLWLADGHEVHVLPDAVRRDPQALVERFAEQGITAWETTPSYVAALAAQTRLAEHLDDRPAEEPFHLMLGGEPLDPGLWSWLRERPAVRAWNLYGPTEVGVDSMVARVADAASPELGAPTAGTAAYVLDDRLRPVPPGASGELWLAGPQLADGYAGRPGTTALSFTADPFAADGSRMYRTGDVVVAGEPDAGGRVAVKTLGRSDDQVKIRGYRVEPGEVESLLRAADGVAQAVVRPRRTERGAELIAWVVPRDPEAQPGEELLAELGRRVPDYMVPAALATIPEVPLTANGKVDEAALPQPRTAGGTGRAPREGAERAVAEAYERLLGVEGVAAGDSFFDLGGHSFVAQPVVSAVNEALGTELPVQAVFQAPTVAGLAALVEGGGGAVAESLRPVLPLRPEGDAAPLFAVHPASGLSWAFSALLPHVAQDRPVMGLQMPGIAPDEPERAEPEDLDELVADYLDTILEIQPEGPYHLVGWSFGGRLAQAIAARLRDRGREVATLGLIDAYPSEEALAGVADEQRMWRGLLAAHGLTEGLPEELGAGAVLETLRAAGNPLGDVPERTVERIARRFRRTGRILDEAPIPTFDGNLHVFEATREVPAGRPAPEAWEEHVTGRVTSSAVDAAHDGMLAPAAVAQMAPDLRRLLSASRD